MTDAGVAHIQQKYLLHRQSAIVSHNDDAAEERTAYKPTQPSNEIESTPQGGADRRSKKSKAGRGQNKARHFSKVTDTLDLCWKVANGSGCPLPAEECRFTHDIKTYLNEKPGDLRVRTLQEVLAGPRECEERSEGFEGSQSINPHTKCPTFETFGECRFVANVFVSSFCQHSCVDLVTSVVFLEDMSNLPQLLIWASS